MRSLESIAQTHLHVPAAKDVGGIGRRVGVVVERSVLVTRIVACAVEHFVEFGYTKRRKVINISIAGSPLAVQQVGKVDDIERNLELAEFLWQEDVFFTSCSQGVRHELRSANCPR